MILKNKAVNIKSSISILRGTPDLTPLVDVIFILLMFIILSSSFIQVTGVEVDLPKIDNQRNKSVGRFIIAINGNNQYFINDNPVKDLEKLKEEINKWKSKSNINVVLIRADKKTPFGVIAKIMAFLEDLSLNAFIATTPVEKSGKDFIDYED